MTNQIDTLIRRVHRAVAGPGAVDRTDGQLLTSFIEQHDEAAFEALVRRHGPTVWGVCRRIVGHHHDAEDAFQATFLVLARKAAAVRPRERVANWLHGVALRTAQKARGMAVKQRVREKQVPEMPEPEAAQHEQWRDHHPALAQELDLLPEKYRLPIRLCDLEGKAIKEVARDLGWPQGTVAGRLARGRKLLGERLAKRGVVLPVGSLAAVVSQNGASAGVPASVVSATVKTAMILVQGRTAGAGAAPAAVVVLMEGVMKSMLRSRLGKAAGLIVAVGVVAFGGGLLMERAGGQPTKSGQAGEKSLAVSPAPLTKDSGTGAKLAPAKTDLDRLQGAWAVVAIEQGGKPAKLEKAVFMVDGKRACLLNGESEWQGGLYLDPASNPKTFDLAMSTRTVEGVYSLDGDTLRLCYENGHEVKRPAGLTTEKSGQFLLVLKRTHGPELFPYRLLDGSRAWPSLIELTPPPPEAAPRPGSP